MQRVYAPGAWPSGAAQRRRYQSHTKGPAVQEVSHGLGAAAHTFEALKPDGTMLLVEPFAHDELSDNLNPVGRMFYSFSTMVCTPASISQEVGLALGAQAGEKRLHDVVSKGGFTRFRRATETPFNLILEARP